MESSMQQQTAATSETASSNCALKNRISGWLITLRPRIKLSSMSVIMIWDPAALYSWLINPVRIRTCLSPPEKKERSTSSIPDHMGKYQPNNDSHAVQTISASRGAFGAMAYWNQNVFFAGSETFLQDYTVVRGLL